MVTNANALYVVLFLISIIVLFCRKESLGFSKFVCMAICIVCFIIVAHSSFLYGTYVGSYKMMRGEYEILYSFNRESVPNDTIIKNEYFYFKN